MTEQINRKKKQMIWFSIKCKPRKDLETLNYLKESKLIFDALIIFDSSAKNHQKKEQNKWPGTIFVKTHLTEGQLDEKIKEFVISVPFFSHIKSYGRRMNAKPILFSEKYIQKLIKTSQMTDEEKTKFSSKEIDFQINDFVTIFAGTFRGYEGEIIEIDYNTGIITLSIEFFGRITPVKVKFNECKKIN